MARKARKSARCKRVMVRGKCRVLCHSKKGKLVSNSKCGKKRSAKRKSVARKSRR